MMPTWQSVTVTLPEEEAYGPHNEELVIRVPKDSFPAEIKPTVGEQLILRSPDGNEIPAQERVDETQPNSQPRGPAPFLPKPEE